MSKLCFLDVDGVINTEYGLHKFFCDYYGIDISDSKMNELVNEAFNNSKLPLPDYVGTHLPFDLDCVSRLYRLQEETSCDYVITSSWRLEETLQEVNDLFALKRCYISFIGRTPNQYLPRGELIQKFIDSYKKPIESYVIIDDDIENIIPFHPHNCVKTNNYYGFQDIDLKKAISILNSSSL